MIKLFADRPKVRSFGPDDLNDDCEGFLARCAVQCWVHSPNSKDWRRRVGSFVAAYRYRTIQRLFQEAFLERFKLGNQFRDLEGLLLSLSAVRREAKLEGVKPQPEIIEKWEKKWMPKFAVGCGPKWSDDWGLVEIKEPFPPAYVKRHSPVARKERNRRGYGLDMRTLLAVFGALPQLNEAGNDNERNHWLCICREMLAAYLRTFPAAGDSNEEEEGSLQMWRDDSEILRIVACRLFQCSSTEQRGLWAPILDLPPRAHHHITSFLSDVLIETIRFEPARVTELTLVWRAMIAHLFASPKWNGQLKPGEDEVWKCLFLYGGSVSSVREKDHAPLVAALRDFFELHIKTIRQDSHDQSDFAAFVISDAGEQLLVDMFEWLSLDWQQARSYFWEAVAERGHFERLLQRAWQRHFSEIRKKPEALKAFKTLTLNLASQQVSTAIEIQKQIAGA